MTHVGVSFQGFPRSCISCLWLRAALAAELESCKNLERNCLFGQRLRKRDPCKLEHKGKSSECFSPSQPCSEDSPVAQQCCGSSQADKIPRKTSFFRPEELSKGSPVVWRVWGQSPYFLFLFFCHFASKAALVVWYYKAAARARKRDSWKSEGDGGLRPREKRNH